MFRISAVGFVLLATSLFESSRGFHIPKPIHSRVAESSLSAVSRDRTDDIIDNDTATTSRRDLLNRLGASTLAGFSLFVASNEPAIAFDGSGASASAGYSPATKAEKKKGYQTRIVADIRDFNKLGAAIDQGTTEGPAWVNFFITFQRREPDSVGRTYAALVDLRGLPTKKAKEFEGGDGLLLANTFTKAGKPPDNTPAVKSFKKLSTTFDDIQAAGKAGDAKKAKAAWLKTSELLTQYLADVELPSDLKDPIYKP